MTLPAPAALPDLVIQSRLFGTVRVLPTHILTFADGIPGFEQMREFVLLPAAVDGTYWLQSLHQPSLAFFLVEARRLDAEAFGETPDLLAIVTLPGAAGRPATANLRAPILVDRASQTGLQLIGVDETWSTAHPFDLASLLHK